MNVLDKYYVSQWHALYQHIKELNALMNIKLIMLMWNMSQFNINQCDHNIFHNGRHYKPSSNFSNEFDLLVQLFLGLNCSGQLVQQSCQYSDTQVIVDQMTQQNIPK